MTIDVSPESLTGAGLAEVPVAVDGLFGWFGAGPSRRAVVLCGTAGYEQLSAHRAWRALAARLRAAGCATFRFDWPGEGDSAGEAPSGVAARVAAVGRAARFLREEAGAEEIVLVGLRLGGTLAALAAAECGADRLALLAPFPSGRAYAREMRMQARTIGRLPDGSALPEEGPGIVTVGGFRVEGAFAQDLGGVDLAKASAAPAPRVLLVGADAGLTARFEALGAAVEARPFPGLAALVANPLFAEVPEEAFAAVTAFAAEGLRPLPTAGRPLRPARLAGEGWAEEAHGFGSGLFSILCRPAGPARGPAVLFVNAGTNVRSGWGRQTTNLARGLAAEGTASLRIDLRGIGDSDDRPGGASPLYSLDTLADVRAALDHLGGLGLGPVVIVGACSGAYLGFHALCRDERLAGALLVNLYCFDWNPDDDVEMVIRNVFRSASTYASLLRQGDAWRRLLRGQVRVGAILGALARAARTRIGQPLGRLLRPPPGGTPARRIAALRRRGARLRLVYAEGDRGLGDLRLQLGRSPERIARRLGEPAVILPGIDHDLSTRAAQGQLADSLRDFLKTVG